jgi:hypothetical protein
MFSKKPGSGSAVRRSCAIANAEVITNATVRMPVRSADIVRGKPLAVMLESIALRVDILCRPHGKKLPDGIHATVAAIFARWRNCAIPIR